MSMWINNHQRAQPTVLPTPCVLDGKLRNRLRLGRLDKVILSKISLEPRPLNNVNEGASSWPSDLSDHDPLAPSMESYR